MARIVLIFVILISIPVIAEFQNSIEFVTIKGGRIIRIALMDEPSLKYVLSKGRHLGEFFFLRNANIEDFSFRYLKNAFYLYRTKSRGPLPNLFVFIDPAIKNERSRILYRKEKRAVVYLIGDVDVEIGPYLDEPFDLVPIR